MTMLSGLKISVARRPQFLVVFGLLVAFFSMRVSEAYVGGDV